MFEHKDISVDNNANGQESIADVDEVVKEVEEHAERNIVWMSGDQDPLPDDDHTVGDAEEGVHQHHPVQDTLGLVLHVVDQVNICGVDQDQTDH